MPNQRGPAAQDPIPESLRPSAAPAQRCVVGQDDRPERGEDHESHRTENGCVDQPAAGRRAHQDDGESEGREGQEAPHTQQGERGQPARCGTRILPAGRQHPELYRGAH